MSFFFFFLFFCAAPKPLDYNSMLSYKVLARGQAHPVPRGISSADMRSSFFRYSIRNLNTPSVSEVPIAMSLDET